MKEIQVARGIRGTRQLAAAYADVLLRRKGELKEQSTKKIGRRGRPWTDSEYDDALAMRMRGRSDLEIAEELNRTINAVQRMIGYGPKVRTGAAA